MTDRKNVEKFFESIVSKIVKAELTIETIEEMEDELIEITGKYFAIMQAIKKKIIELEPPPTDKHNQ